MTTELQVTIPATLASGARLCGEDSLFIISRIARALDPRGSSRTSLEALRAACEPLLSAKHYRRLLEDARGSRYWTLELAAMVLRGETRVLASFQGADVIRSRAAVSFPVAILDTRQRRGAALVAAVLAGSTDPWANSTIARFTGVDRGTLRDWLKDPVIAETILSQRHEWALGRRHVSQLPNSFRTAGNVGRQSFRLSKASSRPKDAGTGHLVRRYYRDALQLRKALESVREHRGDVAIEVARLGSVYVGEGPTRVQYQPGDALQLLGVSPQSADIFQHHDQDDHAHPPAHAHARDADFGWPA